MTMGDVERLYAVVCEEYEQKTEKPHDALEDAKLIEQEGIITTCGHRTRWTRANNALEHTLPTGRHRQPSRTAPPKRPLTLAAMR